MGKLLLQLGDATGYDEYQAVHGVLLPMTNDHASMHKVISITEHELCLLYTSPSPRDATLSRMPSSA